jgi:hypothetical protein
MRESMAPIDELVVYVASFIAVLNNSTKCNEYVGKRPIPAHHRQLVTLSRNDIHEGPPQSYFHQPCIEELKKMVTVTSEYRINWVTGVWEHINNIQLQLYEEQLKVYKLEHSTGYDENDMLRRRLNVAKRKNKDLKAENDILKAEVLIADHKATAVEQAHRHGTLR